MNHLKESNTVIQNIRADLKHHFKNVKFSVTKDGYNSVIVRWNDGVTTPEVYDLLKKFTIGKFDGMTDCYEYNRSNFNKLFGGIEYIFANRSYSENVLLKGIELVNSKGFKFTLENYNNGSFIHYDLARETMNSFLYNYVG